MAICFLSQNPSVEELVTTAHTAIGSCRKLMICTIFSLCDQVTVLLLCRKHGFIGNSSFWCLFYIPFYWIKRGGHPRESKMGTRKAHLHIGKCNIENGLETTLTQGECYISHNMDSASGELL
jgi:hypothetical protein